MYKFILNPIVSGPLGSLVSGPFSSIIDNYYRDTVSEPSIGSVVYCDLPFGIVEHSGIYVGDGKIVHLDGDGIVCEVDKKNFRYRLGGWNTALSVYVSCDGKKSVGSIMAAERARDAVCKKMRRKYNPIKDNCHQFTSGCLTGDFENYDNLFTSLKYRAYLCLEVNDWRVWR